MTDEDDFQASLDADPGNGLLRLLLADWLDENARDVECPECEGKGEHFDGYDRWKDCPHCRGTGTVSDGRRERAAGYRALAARGFRPQHLRPVPSDPVHDHWLYQLLPLHSGDWQGSVRHTFNNRDLDEVAWFRAAEPRLFGCHSRSRREADDRFALAFGRLPADVQARILAGVTA